MNAVPPYRGHRLLAKATLIEGDGKNVLPVRRFTFELPEGQKVLVDSGHGEVVKILAPRAEKSKSYSVTSNLDRCGSFDLTIKIYPGGSSSSYIDSVPVGYPVLIGRPFPPPALRKYRRRGKYVCLIVMGIGITGALHVAGAELLDEAVEKVTMLYANKHAADVLFAADIRKLRTQYSNRFELVSIFSRQRVDGAMMGRADKQSISRAFQLDSGIEIFHETRFHVLGTKLFQKDMWNILQDMGYNQAEHALLLRGHRID